MARWSRRGRHRRSHSRVDGARVDGAGLEREGAAESDLRVWIEAARPRTLSAALAPVLIGTAAATEFIAWRFAAALVVALAVQVGVNYANDYYDGVRGVDTARQSGPRRAVASGLVPPRAMRRAMLAAFGVAGLAGFALAAATTWWLLLVGLLCFVAAVTYSGGPRPYASAALGEVFVFVFFGLVATMGSTWVQMEGFTFTSLVGAVEVGLLAVAILIANNLRDRATDAAAGKRTLAVSLGDDRTRELYRQALLQPFIVGIPLTAVGALSFWPLIGLLALPLAVAPARRVKRGVAGRGLVPVLGATSRAQLAYAVLVSAGLVLA